ncbi:hypothetical protein PS2_022226 [Malus domestica]
MDVITAYLYGELDTDIYMKVLEGLKLPEATNKPRGMFSIKLRRSLYGLKQFGRMWHNCLGEYLIKEGYANNVICPCVFIKKSNIGFAIVAVYVDDMNLVRTPEELNRTRVAQMKERFIKGDKTKHISPRFFSAYELQKGKVTEVRQIHSNENLADLFTKSLPKCTFQKLV